MNSAASSSRFITVLSSKPLRNFVSHYWLSLDNLDTAHSILPDGAVDLVINQYGEITQSWVYGTSTSRTEVALTQQSHYLGIRFKPGQSRHFVNAAANELTDLREPAEGLLLFSLASVLEKVFHADVFIRLNAILENHRVRWQPDPTRIDDVIALIAATHGTIRIDEAAVAFGKCRRQFERVFLETVGVSAKSFSSIKRFHHAVELIQRAAGSLTDIAFASGYSDQSHMSHEFKRLADMSPAMYARGHVAFLQDQT